MFEKRTSNQTFATEPWFKRIVGVGDCRKTRTMNAVAFWALFFFNWIIGLNQVVAQPLYILTDYNSIHLTELPVLEDHTGNLDAADILNGNYNSQFVTLSGGSLNLGYSSSNYWFKFSILNQTDNEQWYIAAQNPLIQFSIYEVEGTDVQILETNVESQWRIPFASINLSRGVTRTFLIKLSSFHTIDGHFRVESKHSLRTRTYHDTIIVVLFAGCLISMIIYNLFLFFSLRDWNYFYYLLFAIVNSHLNLLAVKFPADIYSYLGVDWAAILGLYRPLGPLTTFLFTRSFLQTRLSYPVLDRIFCIYMGGLVLLMLAFPFVPNAQLQNVENAYFLVGIIILLIGGWTSLRRGFNPSKLYLAGIGTFLFSMFIYLSAVAKLLPANPLTLNILLAGQAAEMLLMSLALAGKVKILQDQKSRAEAVAETKSRLVRIMSHDIANPLTILQYAFSMTKQGKMPDNHRARIMRAIAMIEEILRFVRKVDSTDPEFSMDLEEVSLKEAFRNLEILFQKTASEKGIELKFSLTGDDLLVNAEKTTFTNEVLANLLSNAIKFSFPNSVIQIKAYRSGKNLVNVEIEDHGIGMNSEIKEQLFQMSKSPSRRGTNNESGTGYGIMLARSFVSAYGAKLELESRSMDESPASHGTIFRIIMHEVQVDKAAKERFSHKSYILA